MENQEDENDISEEWTYAINKYKEPIAYRVIKDYIRGREKEY
jgi:hypothetical protein